MTTRGPQAWDGERLRLLAAQMLALAEIMPEPQALDDAALDAAVIYRRRRRREALFGANLFRDPAWDILLDLYAQRQRRRTVSVSSACIASHVAPTTALRHVGRLVRRGLVDRRADGTDARRIYLELSPRGLAAMETYLGVPDPRRGSGTPT